MNRAGTKQGGFTLIEVMLAMAIFTFMLLVVSLAYINIARLYNASTAARNVQQNNRFAMEQMSRVARVSKTITVSEKDSTGGLSAICFDKTLFYVADGQLRQASVTDCGQRPTRDYQELSAPGVSVARLEADTSVADVVTIRLWMTSRVDLLETTDSSGLKCRSGAGSEFCAINKLETSVEYNR